MNTAETNPEPTTSEPEAANRPLVAPRVDILENEHEYLVVADLPGVDRDDLTLDFERGQLTLRAKRSLSTSGERLASERADADFGRVFRIPDQVDASKIDAKLAEGVLEVHLPKADANRPRRISIRAVA